MARLIFIHGYSDHINRYDRLFSSLVERGIAVHAFDQRGWGRSVTTPATRGQCGPTDQVLSDMASFIRTILPSPVPVFVLGHSMGGQQVIHFASDAQYEDIHKQIRGWLLSAPFVRFPKGFEPSKIKEIMGKFAAKLMPNFQLYEHLPALNLTRDVEVAKSMDNDELMHSTGTLEGLANMLARADAIDKGHTSLTPSVKSLWIGHGTQDKGTSYEAAKEWFDRLQAPKDRTWKTYDGAYHCLHCDTDEVTSEYCQDVGAWIIARLDDASISSTTESKL